PALHKHVGAKKQSEQEAKLLAQIRLRVANWKRLDTKEFGFDYDASEELKKQSWGTEAVFNALILAFDDRYQGRPLPSGWPIKSLHRSALWGPGSFALLVFQQSVQKSPTEVMPPGDKSRGNPVRLQDPVWRE